jgi:hypothetical protein
LLNETVTSVLEAFDDPTQPFSESRPVCQVLPSKDTRVTSSRSAWARRYAATDQPIRLPSRSAPTVTVKSWADPVRATSRSPYALVRDDVARAAVPWPWGSAATQVNAPCAL